MSSGALPPKETSGEIGLNGYSNEGDTVFSLKSVALIQKLSKIQASIDYIQKRGKNQFHGYNYATEADISEAVRTSLAASGIMMVPSVVKTEVETLERKNKTERLVRLTVRFTLTDGESYISFCTVGEGTDAGDKAGYKAMTGATKYALMKLFLIPTGDDPERDSKNEEEDEVDNSLLAKLRTTYFTAKEKGLCKDNASYMEWARPIVGHSKPVGDWNEEDLKKVLKALA